MTPLDLTRVQRWTLANQYRILELLATDPESAAGCREKYQALENGFAAHYADAALHIRQDTLSPAQCSEVRGVLDMFLTMQTAHSQLEAESPVTTQDVRFPRFDSQTESRLHEYTSYLQGLTDGRYATLLCDSDAIGGEPQLKKYRKMLALWGIRKRDRLSPSELEALVAATKGR